MSALVKSPLSTISCFSRQQIELIKSHLMAGQKDSPTPSDEELALYCLICQQTGLDPFSKQIYAIQRKGKWTFQISIDGYRYIADRTGQYAGSDEPLFDEGLDAFEFESQGRTVPKVCKVTVYKLVGGQRCPFVGVARFSEFAQKFNGRLSDTWEKLPCQMLAVAAERQALRKAFPTCQSIDLPEKNMEQVYEEDDWRVSGYEWAIKQGVDPEAARLIANQSTSKVELFEAMKPLIPRPVLPQTGEDF